MIKLPQPLQWPPVRWLVQRLDGVYFWGSRYSEVSVYRFLQVWLRNLGQHEFMIKASAMSYSFFLAFIPAIIFAFSVIPFFPVDNLQARIENVLETILPVESYAMLHKTVLNTLVRKNVALLSVSFISVVFFSLRGIRTMMSAFKKADPVHFKRRGILREYLVAMFIQSVLILLLALGMTVLVIGEWGIGLLADVIPNSYDIVPALLHALARFISILVLVVGISFIYFVAPSLRTRWRFFSFGAIVSGVLMFIAHLVLKSFAAGLFHYDNLYGSLSAVILLLLWFFYLSCVLLIGFEINTSLDQALELVRRQKMRTAQKESPTIRT